MDRKHFFRLAWALTLLIAFGMGCKLVNQAQDMIALATVHARRKAFHPPYLW